MSHTGLPVCRSAGQVGSKLEALQAEFGGPRGRSRPRRAFTIIELLVCIGLILILISLALPSMARSIESSRNLRDCAQIRQNHAIVTLYATDHKEVFPIVHQNAFLAGIYWWKSVERAGYVSSPREVDPRIFDRFGVVTIALSVCLVYKPERMLPGFTVPIGQALSDPVRLSQVSFPSSKGGLFRRESGEGSVNEGARWHCCVVPWDAAVGFCDGSAIVTNYLQLSGGTQPLRVDEIGVPVWTTWGGYLARDR